MKRGTAGAGIRPGECARRWMVFSARMTVFACSEQRRQQTTRSVHAAFDGSFGATASLRHVGVGKSGASDQDQRLAMVRSQPVQCVLKVKEGHVGFLFGPCFHSGGVITIDIFDLATALTVLRVEKVAKYGGKPGTHV